MGFVRFGCLRLVETSWAASSAWVHAANNVEAFRIVGLEVFRSSGFECLGIRGCRAKGFRVFKLKSLGFEVFGDSVPWAPVV